MGRQTKNSIQSENIIYWFIYLALLRHSAPDTLSITTPPKGLTLPVGTLPVDSLVSLTTVGGEEVSSLTWWSMMAQIISQNWLRQRGVSLILRISIDLFLLAVSLSRLSEADPGTSGG